jgi:hypothetical protein
VDVAGASVEAPDPLEVVPPADVGEDSPLGDPDASEDPEDVSPPPEPDVVEEPAEAPVLPPAAFARLAASAAAVGSEALVSTGVDIEVDEEDAEESPAAGRSGRRTSTYQALAALGEVRTRASDSHLACGRMELPK